MATQGGIGSGGFGGFNAFPYRSPHQQGGGGGGRGRRGGGSNQRGRSSQQKHNNAAAKRAFEMEILVPVDRRTRLIGTGGSVVKELVATTNTIIDVPGKKNDNPRHPVRIKGETIGNVLHACWKVSKLILDDENESVICVAKFRQEKDASYKGIIRRRQNEAFLVEENEELLVFFLECSMLTKDSVAVIVDNERFVDPQVDASCDIVQLGKLEKEKGEELARDGIGLIIYGNPTQKPQQLFASLEKAELEQRGHN